MMPGVTDATDGRDWQLLQYHEGGVAEYADEDDGFWLRTNFGTMRDFDPTLSEDECRSLRQFKNHADRRRVACQEGLCHLGPEIAVYCVDVGAVHSGHFGFWRRFPGGHTSGEDPDELVALLGEDLGVGRRITLGFECPLSIPVPSEVVKLGRARPGERNRAWSAGAGTAVLALGLQQLAWTLRRLDEKFERRPKTTFRWPEFVAGAASLHLWEAFVTGPGRGDDIGAHVADARAGAEELIWRAAQLGHSKDLASDIYTGSGLNLAVAAVLWARLVDDAALLHEPITVIAADRGI